MTIKHLSKNKMYYLASPYSHITTKTGWLASIVGYFVRHRRFKAVSDAAVYLIKSGYTCLEPIAMCHYKSLRYELPTGYQYWQKRDRWFIRKCDGIVVLTLDGWMESEGVQDELQYARNRGLDIVYLNPNTYITTVEKRRRKKSCRTSKTKDVINILQKMQEN